MFNRRFAALGFVLGAATLAPTLAQAHERDFSFLRDWFLPYKFEREIEYRYTHVKAGDFNAHELEYEYGITPHFAIEPGIEFVKEQGGKFHVDGYDTELRFNFGEFKTNTLLPALNVEYEHPVDKDEDDHAELKFIGSYYDDAGNDLSLNVNIGWALKHRREQESEFALGFMHPTRPGMGHRGEGWKYGFEFQEDLVEHHSVLGPTVTFRANEHLHVLATFGFGLQDKEDNTLKFIAEYEF
jgi:hypothetical protein